MEKSEPEIIIDEDGMPAIVLDGEIEVIPTEEEVVVDVFFDLLWNDMMSGGPFFGAPFFIPNQTDFSHLQARKDAEYRNELLDELEEFLWRLFGGNPSD